MRRSLPVSLTFIVFVLFAGPRVRAALPAGSPDQQADGLNATAALDDVEAAFARIPVSGEHFTASSNGLIPKPRYRATVTNGFFGVRNHFQGIQRLPHNGYLVISGSNNRGSELFLLRLAGEEGREGATVVARIGVDSEMGHAGGLSMVGNIMAVPLHGGAPRNAKVVFYDFSEPEHPRKLPVEIDRPGRKASATAFARLANGHFLVAVLSAFDGLPRRMDVYLSRGAALEDGFLPQPATWFVSDVQARDGQEKTFAFFQTINFIQQEDGRLYMVGFHNSFFVPSFLPGRDHADLYEIVFPENTVNSPTPVLAMPSVIKVATRPMRCTGGYCNLDAAGGLSWIPTRTPCRSHRNTGLARRRHREAHGVSRGPIASSLTAAALELIALVGEQHIERRQRTVTAAHVRLQLHLRVVRQLGRVHLLLERSQAIPQHHDLVEERLDRNGLLLKIRRAWTKDERASAPFFRRGDGCDAGFLPDDSAQQ